MTWSRFKTHCYHNAALGVSLDVSRMPFPEGFLAEIEAPMNQAFTEMAALEKGRHRQPR